LLAKKAGGSDTLLPPRGGEDIFIMLWGRTSLRNNPPWARTSKRPQHSSPFWLNKAQQHNSPLLQL
jgi:hypothetical protein